MRFEWAAQRNPGPFRAGSSELSGDSRQGACRSLPERRIALINGRVLQMLFLRIFVNERVRKLAQKRSKIAKEIY